MTFWNGGRENAKYNTISTTTWDVLNVHVSIMASTVLFSQGKMQLSEQRNRLTGQTLDNLIKSNSNSQEEFQYPKLKTFVLPWIE